MGITIDAQASLESGDFADVVLHFGNPLPTEKIKCHKLILSGRSEYFKALLKQHSGFKESDATVIELKGDDVWAFKTMMKYIYTDHYDAKDIKYLGPAWYLHFEVARVADKYGLRILQTKALWRFAAFIEGPVDILTVVDILSHVKDLCVPKGLEELTTGLRNKYFAKLIQLPKFRTMLSKDEKLMWECLERGAFAHDLIERFAMHCTDCEKASVLYSRPENPD